MMPQPMTNGTITPARADEQRRAADAHQLRCLHVQAHAEEEEHDAEVGEDGEDFVRRHPAEHVRADQDAGQDLADDPGLADALEDFGQELGRGEDHEHRERDLEALWASAAMTSLWREAE